MNNHTNLLGNPAKAENILVQLKKHPESYRKYLALDLDWRTRFSEFCEGKRSLPLTYDPFFKKIFHPDIHPERLSRLLSSLLGVNVKVKSVLPTEDSPLNGESLLIMDILVELEDGSLANVEIQKIGYAFTAERATCYSADVVMRQYTRVKGEKGRSFSYKDMKKVYTIIFYEKSPKVFHEFPGDYIHMGKTVFNTGLPVEMLQEYCMVALDVFRDLPYPKIRSEQTAWLSLLAAEKLEEAERLIEEYPWLEEIYQEIAMMRQKPEEVLGMFSDALKILDKNTVHYMIEEQQKEIEEQQKILAEQKGAIAEQEKAIAEQEKAIVEQEKAIAEQEKAIAEQEKAIVEQEKVIAEREKTITEQEREIAELKHQLEAYRKEEAG